MTDQDCPTPPKGISGERAVEDREHRVDDLHVELTAVAKTVQDLAVAVQGLSTTMDDVLSHLGDLQEDHDRVKTGLWEKTAGLTSHLADLQSAHDAAKETAWAQSETARRMETLWSDTHREITALAEALSRLEND